jgi:hypothetical protein
MGTIDRRHAGVAGHLQEIEGGGETARAGDHLIPGRDDLVVGRGGDDPLVGEESLGSVHEDRDGERSVLHQAAHEASKDGAGRPLG